MASFANGGSGTSLSFEACIRGLKLACICGEYKEKQTNIFGDDDAGPALQFLHRATPVAL